MCIYIYTIFLSLFNICIIFFAPHSQTLCNLFLSTILTFHLFFLGVLCFIFYQFCCVSYTSYYCIMFFPNILQLFSYPQFSFSSFYFLGYCVLFSTKSYFSNVTPLQKFTKSLSIIYKVLIPPIKELWNSDIIASCKVNIYYFTITFLPKPQKVYRLS